MRSLSLAVFKHRWCGHLSGALQRFLPIKNIAALWPLPPPQAKGLPEAGRGSLGGGRCRAPQSWSLKVAVILCQVSQ